jgi:HTH-type transcriptional regulator/antitoxin HigA
VVPQFDRATLESLLPRLRALTAQEPNTAIAEAVTRLHQVGVIVCFIPAVPGLGIYGATRWVNKRPVIQLSLRGKSDDQFWFTLFHELGHVLLHGERDLYLLGAQTEAEAEANSFATETLIPAAYSDKLPRRRDTAAVEALARELGIAPSLVLGQAQRLTGDFKWGHQLKRKLDFVKE